jgi:hypothetical protein
VGTGAAVCNRDDTKCKLLKGKEGIEKKSPKT